MISKNRVRDEVAKGNTNVGISYEGSVKIEYKRKNKTYKVQVNHNEGLKYIFEILANVLTGKVDNVEMQRPKYIRMFHIDNEGQALSFDDERGASNVPYSSVWNEYTGEGIDAKATANFQFVIPYSYLSIDSHVNELAIYSEANQGPSARQNASAYVVLRDKETGELTELEADGKSNIVITWTMTVSNGNLDK